MRELMLGEFSPQTHLCGRKTLLTAARKTRTHVFSIQSVVPCIKMNLCGTKANGKKR